jgi:pimeloyl-ACP methyl ester carboxylesterase
VPRATRDGVGFHYERAGAGEPPLLFVPGWCCDASFFQPQFDHFAASHEVVALELRGCGRSDRPGVGYDIPTQTDDVAWLIGELALERPVVVGHSLGGMLGVDLGARYPSLVSAVVAVDPGPFDKTPEARDLFARFAEDMRGPSGDEARDAYVADMAALVGDETIRRQIVEAMCSVPLEHAAPVIDAVNEWDGGEALSRCAVPLLVLKSNAVGSNAPDRLLARNPNVQIGITVGAGHFHQLEVPDQVNPMIERFVSSLR